MKHEDPRTVIRALELYHNNVDEMEWFIDWSTRRWPAMDSNHCRIMLEPKWEARYLEGPMALMDKLDRRSLTVHLELVMERYGEEAAAFCGISS